MRCYKINYLKSKIQKESFIQEYLPNESRIVQSSADNVPQNQEARDLHRAQLGPADHTAGAVVLSGPPADDGDGGDVAAQHHEQGEQPEEAENEGNVEVVVMMLFICLQMGDTVDNPAPPAGKAAPG